MYCNERNTILIQATMLSERIVHLLDLNDGTWEFVILGVLSIPDCFSINQYGNILN